MNNKILIMMSTYNGEKFLIEQLESILNQTFDNFKLMIRDDGSKDKTKEILKYYKKKNPKKIEIIYGKNCGAKNSFLKLLTNCSDEYRFYAFADQDDIWKSNKLELAINKIQRNDNIPFLYFSNYDIVTENLTFVRKGYIKSKKIFSLENSLVQCMGLGCTMVFNKKLLDIIKIKQYDYEDIIMHDYWIYFIATTFGKIYLDYESTLLYRQHGKNVYGATISRRKKIKNLLTRINRSNSLSKYRNQSVKFLKIYENYLEENKKEILKKFIHKGNFISRFYNILKKRVIFNNKSNYLVKNIKAFYFILNRE